MTLGRCLVTGGRGFIGARLVAALRADGVTLRVLTRGDVPGPDEVRGELADPDSLARACEGVDTVFHCAGHAHAFGALSADEAARHRQVNLEGTRALAEAAGRAGVRGNVSVIRAPRSPPAFSSCASSFEAIAATMRCPMPVEFGPPPFARPTP